MGFSFENNAKKVKIEIEGKVYFAQPGAKYEKIAKAYKKKALEITDKLERGEIDDEKATNILLDNTEKEIDEILGAGSSKVIFKGRERNAFDWSSVLTYIRDCLYPRVQGKYSKRKR